MPATAPEIGRRAWLLALAAACLRADASDEVFDLFRQLASALSAGNAVDFMRYFDPHMPQYDLLRSYVAALCDQSEVTCSIAISAESGDERTRSVTLDWLMQIASNAAGGGVTRRHEAVSCSLRKEGKRWKITALSPVQLFAPLRP